MSLGPFADVQDEVYLKGLSGEQPTLPCGGREAEDAVHHVLRPSPSHLDLPAGPSGHATARELSPEPVGRA